MILLDGKSLSSEINKELKNRMNRLIREGIRPGLGIIIIGNNRESLKYIDSKKKVCNELGIYFELIHLKENEEEKNIILQINKLNVNDKISGIIVQLPLPYNLNEKRILNMISADKDVDGFHIMNAGKLFLNRDIIFTPCTPLGCIKLLEHYNIDVKGMRATVIGGSNIVGLPLCMMLIRMNATVTLCHKHTIDLKEHTIQSDIIFCWCGVPGIIKKDMIKKGVIIIDIGINFVNGKLIGDVDFNNVKEKCSYITPVPGGVGPMTISMLMKQTIESSERLNKLSFDI